MTLRRYLYGWQMAVRALWLARRKKHGAGAQPWKYAIKTAACYRFLVDGQFKTPPRLPRWARHIGR